MFLSPVTKIPDEHDSVNESTRDVPLTPICPKPESSAFSKTVIRKSMYISMHDRAEGRGRI